MILSHNSRINFTCECNKEGINDDDDANTSDADSLDLLQSFANGAEGETLSLQRERRERERARATEREREMLTNRMRYARSQVSSGGGNHLTQYIHQLV